MKNIFIIGSKGIPAKYGGFETFVDNLVTRRKNENIKYYVSCLSDEEGDYDYKGAECFNVSVPNIGSAKAIIYDIKSLIKCVNIIKRKELKNCCIYILACRIGPFLFFYKQKLSKLGIEIYVNPDGHEWLRSKWNKFIKMYWKYSEKLMVKKADLLVCDSVAIEKYIKDEYKDYNPNTTFIAYGADVEQSSKDDESLKKLRKWYTEKKVKEYNYYLIVGRFVPENNYDLMIREFMKSHSEKDLVIITNVEENKFYNNLKESTNFQNDSRIKFVGTVYDSNLIKLIRENAYGYIHGHEVGGTNPSLLEALASTDVNLLLDVSFNKEVGKDGAVYFSKVDGELTRLIDSVDKYPENFRQELSKKAKNRVKNSYSWDKIVDDYEQLWRK